MMPRAAHAVADHDPVGERRMVMAAMGPDGEQFGAAAYQQHLVTANMADQLAVDEVVHRNALRQVRTGGRSLLLCHGGLPGRQAVMLRNSWRSSGLSRKQ